MNYWRKREIAQAMMKKKDELLEKEKQTVQALIKEKEQLLEKKLEIAQSANKLSIMCINPVQVEDSEQITQDDVIHAYDVSLRASKEKKQQLQSQLATVQQESQDKEQQLSKLEDENHDLHKKMVIVKYVNEQQQEELKRLQQKAGEDEVRVTASKEEQQRLLQQYQRMGLARDVQISQLQKENELVQDKYGALKASYLQLKAVSNEKLSVDTVDTGVQADYLAVAPGFLRGVEVYGETVLEVVGDRPQKLLWPGYSFYIEVPDGALPPGMTASVGVKVILSGQFILPSNAQLISAIYYISFSKNFLKEVSINIRHFGVMISKKQCSKFRFIISECSQKELPYDFQECEGLFTKHTQFAVIKLKSCPCTLVGEIGPENTEMRFMCHKFYKPIPGTLKVDLVFVVTYDHELFLEIIRTVYCHYLEDRQCQILVFDSDTMVLDLPAGGFLVDGWRILPLTHPQIARADVQHFQLGNSLPACTIELEWTGYGEPKYLRHRVNIIGVKEPNNYFNIRYNPQTAVAPATNTSAATP